MRLHELLQKYAKDAGYDPAVGGWLERLRAYLDARYIPGVSQSAISQWFSGKRIPTRGNLLALMDALGVHNDDRSALMAAYFAEPSPDAASSAA
jgi:transcriptional regulator with XRE-family HTH domain